MSHNFIIGATARIPVTITDLASHALADPGGVVLKIRKPDKTLTTLIYGTDAAVIKASIGMYYADVVLDQSGTWKWRWEAAAPHTGVAEGYLDVLTSYVL